MNGMAPLGSRRDTNLRKCLSARFRARYGAGGLAWECGLGDVSRLTGWGSAAAMSSERLKNSKLVHWRKNEQLLSRISRAILLLIFRWRWMASTSRRTRITGLALLFSCCCVGLLLFFLVLLLLV